MQQEEEEEEEEQLVRPSSPFRLAIPVSRNAPPSGAEEPQGPPVSLPVRPAQAEPEPAPAPAAGGSGITARAEYDYEKAEDNEIDLAENEIVRDIQKVDEDWWLGTNGKGETGLFPSNYVVEIEGGADASADASAAAPVPAAPAPVPAAGAGAAAGKPTATSMYDYEAAEDNELGFPEGAKIVNVEFPDEDWWFGEYNGKSGLFPANYVELDQ
ncbi:hypothetical protein KEM55_003299 [Ascosphaera atra]|nr:hypothetical protein KEM55_003299 [Ascosphaera atra]